MATLLERFAAWMRGDDVTPRSNFHYVPATSLEQMRVATELQQGTASAYLLSQTAIFRGVQLLTDVTASIPWYGYAGGEPAMTGMRRLTPARKLQDQPALLIQPNPFEDRDTTIRTWMESMIWHGNAYWIANRVLLDSGGPLALTVADPNEMVVSADPADRTRRTYHWRGRDLTPGRDVFHDWLVRVPGGILGTGPLSAGSAVVRGNIAADAWTRSMFQEGAIPAAVLQNPAELTDDEAKQQLQQWEDLHTGKHKTGLLSGGTTFSQVSLTPEQAQYIMTRSYGTQEGARLLGVPQWLLNAGSPPGSGSALTYQNLAAVFLELVKATIDPTYLRRLEMRFSRFLPRGQSVTFDVDHLTRSDAEARSRTWANALGGAPYMTQDEVREAEDLPPGADLPTAAPGTPPAVPAPSMNGGSQNA